MFFAIHVKKLFEVETHGMGARMICRTTQKKGERNKNRECRVQYSIYGNLNWPFRVRTLVKVGRVNGRWILVVVGDVNGQRVERHDDGQPIVRQQPKNGPTILGHTEVSFCKNTFAGQWPRY